MSKKNPEAGDVYVTKRGSLYMITGLVDSQGDPKSHRYTVLWLVTNYKSSNKELATMSVSLYMQDKCIYNLFDPGSDKYITTLGKDFWQEILDEVHEDKYDEC